MSATPDPLVGRTIAGVERTPMRGRDTYKDDVFWTNVTLTFTDGTTHTFTEDQGGEVYDARPGAWGDDEDDDQ